MSLNVTTGSVVGMLVAGLAYALTRRQHAYDDTA